jgi:quercetin dioxygenase-like cupin family protein
MDDTTTNTPQTSFEPAFYKVDDLDRIGLIEGISAQFVTGSRIMFSFVRLAPGAVMPAHNHRHEQLGYVIEGSMKLTIDQEERDLQPGEAYTIPGGVTHSAVAGPNGSFVLDAFSPPREDYLAYAHAARAE